MRVWGADNPNKGMGQKTKFEFLSAKAKLALASFQPGQARTKTGFCIPRRNLLLASSPMQPQKRKPSFCSTRRNLLYASEDLTTAAKNGFLFNRAKLALAN